MGFRDLLQKFGAWTTVIKWQEPWMYRSRLRGDFFPRLTWAFAIGSVPTTLLLVLFAINVKPPHPLFAFIGMAIFGVLALLLLIHGRETAGGRVRICEEGIIRRRMYAGLTSQWSEEASWPYSQIMQCAILTGQSIDKPFALLMFTDGTNVELIGIPERVDLPQLSQLLTAKGVVVRSDVGLPPQFVRPMGSAIPLVAGALSLFMLLGGFGFYALKTGGLGGKDVVAGNDDVPRIEDRQPLPDAVVPAVPPIPMEEVPASAPPDTPSTVQPDSATSALPMPNEVPPIGTEAATQSPSIEPLPGREPDPAAATAEPPIPATSPVANSAKTDLQGGTGGVAFEVLSPNREPIVGFRFSMGNWGGKAAVAQLDPVSERDAPARNGSLVIAREGFVVGGIQVDAEELVEAVRVVFVKRAADGTLDKNDYYFSDWIGQQSGRAVKTLGKGTVPVIGVHGRRGLVIDAIGLVLAE